MTNKVKDADLKKNTYYFFNDIINRKKFDSNDIKLDEKLYNNILIYYTGYVTIKDLKHLQINSLNPLQLIFRKVNGYCEKNNENNYLIFVPTNESKEKINKDEELWIKFMDLFRSVTKNLDDYDEIYMKIKFTSDEKLPLNKTIEIPSMIIVVRAAFLENQKYHPEVLLDECLYNLWILVFNVI